MIKLLATAVIAAAAGGSVGVSAAEFTSSETPRAVAVASSTTATTRTTSRSASSRPATTTTSAAAPRPSIRLSVLYTILRAGVSPAEAASRTARVSIQLRVRNLSSRAIVLARPRLEAGGHSVGAYTVTNNLLPLPARTSARAVVAFETVGPLTDLLTSAKRAQLRFGTRVVPVAVRFATRSP